MFRSLLLLTAGILLAGCAAFPQHKVAAVPLPIILTPHTGSLYVDLRTYEGTPGPAAVPEGTTYATMQAVTLAAMHESNLFQDVRFADAMRGHTTFAVRLSIYHEPSNVWPYVTVILNYFSATLIPVYADDQYQMTLELLDNQNHSVMKLSNSDAVHRYGGLLFLPAAMSGKTVSRALNGTLDNQIESLLLNAEQQNWFRE